MGYIPPPLPLSREEFLARWNAGARTLEELDPDFAEWKKNNERMRNFLLIGLGLVIIVMIFALLFI